MSTQPPFLPGSRGPRLLFGLALLLVLALLPMLPTGPGSWNPTTCAIHAMTGLPCPLCGGTRAAKALMHGDVATALRLNALALPAVVLIAIIGLLLISEAIRGRPWVDWTPVLRRSGRFAPWGVLFLLIWWIPQLFGALRGSKPELLDTRNPVAHYLQQHFGQSHL